VPLDDVILFFPEDSFHSLEGSRGTDQLVRDLRQLCSIYKNYFNTGSVTFPRDNPDI
jgi:hypothetical protein